MKAAWRFLVLAMVSMGAPIPGYAEEDWRFRLTPYVWLAGVKGEVSSLPGQPAVPIDVSPWDALKDTEATLMLILEAKKNRHGLLAEMFYGKVQSEFDLIPAIGLTLTATSKSTMFSAAYLYELYSLDQTVVDIFGGARYWRFDTRLQFGGGLGILAGRSVRSVDSWVDPMVGIKGRTPLGTSNFYLSGGVAAGGLSFGSDRFYDLVASVGYQWNAAIGTTLAYRYLDVKYQQGTYLYDVVQQGWALGLAWAF